MATNTNQTWKRVTLFSPHGPPQHQAAGELSRLQHGLNLPPPPPLLCTSESGRQNTQRLYISLSCRTKLFRTLSCKHTG